MHRVQDDFTSISGENFERLFNGDHSVATKFSWTPDIVSGNDLVIYRSSYTYLLEMT
jgi:hypothetical protein